MKGAVTGVLRTVYDGLSFRSHAVLFVFFHLFVVFAARTVRVRVLNVGRHFAVEESQSPVSFLRIIFFVFRVNRFANEVIVEGVGSFLLVLLILLVLTVFL